MTLSSSSQPLPLTMAVSGCALSSDSVVVKSPTDRRLYRFIQLNNNLCALLVHDPEIYSNEPSENQKMEYSEDEGEDEVEEEGEEEDTENEDDSGEEGEDDLEEIEEANGWKASVQKKAAAAMCVGMGSFADPYEAQGLAHFLEHMLFMGSTEFPDENEYDSFLSKHGGSSNAYTETEYTCYHFEVKREFLKGALTRFAQFFSSPLVKAEAMEREVLAVDSEFHQVLQSDSCRLQQLQCHTSVSGHPFNRFFWGNKKSLADAMEKGINIRDRALKLYEDNYHGGSMKLVVIGGETLEVLEGWVLELFSNVKKGLLVESVTGLDIPVWETGKLYWLEAVKDVHILDLSWTLPSLRKDYLNKAEDYLAHLLGHEGRGSLHSFLKAKGWATSVSADVGDDGIHRSTIAYIFVMSIRLTDCGLEKITVTRDQCMEQIKKAVEELRAAQAETAGKLNAILARMSLPDASESWNKESSMSEEENLHTIMMQKMELPSFDGPDARTWLARAKQYFLVNKVPQAEKVELPVIALSGSSMSWYHMLITRVPQTGLGHFPT